ncbi:MAG TPA: MXAN_5187 C-terminal domain-containing protein [Geobacteraceae bacterium]
MGVQEDLQLFEQSLSELIIKYEQYFLGLEKREPLKLLEKVERCARIYANIPINNTMYKFRYNSLVAKLCSYKQYWTRINRLIEDGKYSRDRFKMERHLGQTTGPSAPPAPPNGNLDRLYQQYIEARRQCHLPVNNITREMVQTVIEKQKPLIMDRYNCAAVEFKVVVQDGKPKIKARPAKPVQEIS